MDYHKFRKQEEEKYAKWLSSMEEVSCPIYIIYGKSYWMEEMIEGLSNIFNKRPERILGDLGNNLDRMRFRSIGRGNHFIWFDTVGKGFSKQDFASFKSYLNNPVGKGLLLVTLHDWSEIHFLRKVFRNLDKSKNVYLFDMGYVSVIFRRLHIESKFKEMGIGFENKKLEKEVISNLGLKIEDLRTNLEILSDLGDKITREDVKEGIEQYSDNNVRKLHGILLRLDRKNVPYVLVRELLDDGVRPAYIMGGIKRYFNYIFQAKYLRLRGITLSRVGEEMGRAIYEKKGIKFSDKDNIWDLEKWERDLYLDESEEISLPDLINILKILEDGAIYRERKGGGKVEIVDRDRLMLILLRLMGRFEEEEVS